MPSTIEQETRTAVESIAAERAVQDPPTGGAYTAASRTKAASPKQVYRLAREAFDLLGLDWPASCADASALIGELAAANTAKREQARTAGEMPF